MTKKYNIDTFDKLANAANDSNYKVLAVDLAQVFMFYYEQIKNFRKELPEETKGKLNTDIAKFGFKFIDDGKNNLVGCELQNTDTGEINKIEFKRDNETN